MLAGTYGTAHTSNCRRHWWLYLASWNIAKLFCSLLPGHRPLNKNQNDHFQNLPRKQQNWNDVIHPFICCCSQPTMDPEILHGWIWSVSTRSCPLENRENKSRQMYPSVRSCVWKCLYLEHAYLYVGPTDGHCRADVRTISTWCFLYRKVIIVSV